MKKFVCILALLILFSVPVFAENDTEITEDEDIINSLISQDVSDFFDKQNITFEDVKSMTFTDVLKILWQQFTIAIKKPFKLFLKIFVVFIFSGFLKQFKSANEGEGLQNAIDAAVIIFIFITLSVPCLSLLNNVEETLNTAKNALISFIPVFTSVMLGCGQTAQAIVYGGMFLSMACFVAMFLIKYIIPFIKIFMALTITQGISENLQLSGITSFISKAIKWGIGLLSTVFVGILSIQTFISQSTDTMALRVGKFVVGSGVPVIGRAVSEAMGTVFEGLKIVKGMVGIVGVIALLSIFVPLLINCLVHYFIIIAGKCVADVMGNNRAANVLAGFGECISIYIVVILFFALLLIFATLLMMLTGSGGI